MRSSVSDERDRRGPRAGGAAQLWMGEDQGELANTVGGEGGQIKVLDHEDAVVDVEDLRDLEGAVGVLGGHWAVAPGVAARERDAALGEPVGDLAAGAGLAGQVGLRVVPVRAPARVEEDGVAGLGVDAGEVLDPDHTARAEPGGVDQPPARDDLRHGLDAEVLDAGRVRELGDAPAVVAAVGDLEVAERVEVRAELLRARDDLGDPVDLVLPPPAAVAVMRGGHERLAEVAPREDGNALVEDAAEVV